MKMTMRVYKNSLSSKISDNLYLDYEELGRYQIS